LWAIGVISALLVSGESIFVDPDDQPYHGGPNDSVLGRASICDLSVLDRKQTWQKVSKRAKDFVKKLLVLDESKRMTVKDALAHPWFTNKIHAQQYNKLYQRAIADWQPNSRNSAMIQALDIRRLGRIAEMPSADPYKMPATSHHFALPEASPYRPPSQETPSGDAVQSSLPQIIEEKYRVDPSVGGGDQSTLDQRARNLIAEDLGRLEMSLGMHEMSLGQDIVESDIDLLDSDADESESLPHKVDSLQLTKGQQLGPARGLLSRAPASRYRVEQHKLHALRRSSGVAKKTRFTVGDGFNDYLNYSRTNYGRGSRAPKRRRAGRV
jgi:Protein kinase domain